MQPEVLAALALAVCAACAAPMSAARLDAIEPTLPHEETARARLQGKDCDRFLNSFLPGLAQVCLGESAEAGAIMSLSLAEIGAGTAAALDGGITRPGAALPLLAASDLLLYSVIDLRLEQQRAERLRFVPPETFGELVGAPFNPSALASPDVFLGILGGVAAGLAVSALADRSALRPVRPGGDPNLFGVTVDRAAGYPLAVGIGALTFDQVALAEETFFRGYVQSGIARNTSETAGWLWGSAIFGAAHALNALFIDDDAQKLAYVSEAVPFLTAFGAYLGLVYRWHDYSLIPSTAVHFWYDFLLSAIPFLLHPGSSAISARIGFPF
jgi:membrane protease YdiL (CAAX protease family)